MDSKAVLKKHLDKHNVEITKMFVGYLHDAMEEYSNNIIQKLAEYLKNKIDKETTDRVTLITKYEVLNDIQLYINQQLKTK